MVCVISELLPLVVLTCHVWLGGVSLFNGISTFVGYLCICIYVIVKHLATMTQGLPPPFIFVSFDDVVWFLCLMAYQPLRVIQC